MLSGMYLTMSPLIAGGIANMLFTKTALYKKLKSPIDRGKKLKDGKRLFGDNKTLIGFLSMIVFCVIFQVLCGFLCNRFSLNGINDLYISNSNTLVFNILFGASIGFVYMLCELPNSFIKRRLSIPPGKTSKGLVGALFFLIDQIDSLIGVMLILLFITDIGIAKYFAYVLLGALTHILVNLLLYAIKVRKNL